MQPRIAPFYDPSTGTVSYVVSDGTDAAVIDAVLDLDIASGHTHTASVDRLLTYIRDQRLTVQWILETHAHADHLSASHYIKAQVGGRTAIGSHICDVQAVFKTLYNFDKTFMPDGSQFDYLLADNESIRIGTLTLTALLVPGHTPADMAYQVGDAVFVGDTLFMPDVGTARADFPGGCAQTLYRSIKRVLGLPETTRLFVCHDYPPQGREARWETTVAQQRAENIHVHDGVTEAEFVAMRQARDATLAAPTLILPSLQVNIRAGALPPPEANGVSYLKIPLNTLAVG